MPEFCDVAVPVPLDAPFTYRIPPGACIATGSRVVVPFGRKRLVGIVTELHDRPPRVTAKNVLESPDSDLPALTPELLRLGKWISEYYLAPVGEVFRTMLPLNAEFRRSVVYQLTEDGELVLHVAGAAGSPARSRRTAEEEAAEFRALEYLSGRGPSQEAALRSATGVSRELLAGMIRKK